MGEKSCDSAVVQDEMPVKIGETQESLELLTGVGYVPLYHCLDLGWVCLQLPLLDVETQESHSGDMKLKLFCFQK